MKYNTLSLLLAVLMVAACPVQVAAAGSEYSATIRESSPQQGARESRIFSGKDGLRTEFEANGEKLVQIVNFRTQQLLLLKPGERSYMRRPLGQPGLAASGHPQQSMPANPCEGQKGLVCKSSGIETINGRKAEKWIISPATAADKNAMTVWLDQQRHIPLRQIMPNGATMSRQLIGTETVNRRQAEKWKTTVVGPKGSDNVSYQWYDRALDTNIREEQPGGYVRELVDIRIGPQSPSLFDAPGDYRETSAGEAAPQGR